MNLDVSETFDPATVISRLLKATNDHDVTSIAACFAADYQAEMPLHPSRSFTGRAQVHTNWKQILTFVPDLVAAVVQYTVDGETVWSEWEFRGTRLDGPPHFMRGVIIFRVKSGVFSGARLYLEPVKSDGSIDENVGRDVSPGRNSAIVEPTRG